MRLSTRHEQGSSRSHRDAAEPGARNWVTVLRPGDDSGTQGGGGVPRTWRREGLGQEGRDRQLKIQDCPQKPPCRRPLGAWEPASVVHADPGPQRQRRMSAGSGEAGGKYQPRGTSCLLKLRFLLVMALKEKKIAQQLCRAVFLKLFIRKKWWSSGETTEPHLIISPF